MADKEEDKKRENNEKGQEQNIAPDWGGMETGVVPVDMSRNYKLEADAAEQLWGSDIDSAYKNSAQVWQNQRGMMKIIPTQQIQRFTNTTMAYAANGMPDPIAQIIPIANVSLAPHQISFSFFDTTEGHIGISNAVEKTLLLECDVYVTDLVYYFWNHGTNDKSNWDGLKQMHALYNYINSLGPNFEAEDIKDDDILDFEQTTAFINFRNTFLTQFSGWKCKFVSHAFPTFYGVFTEIKYDISEGETFAKWHLKIEEALFTNDGYSTSGKKQEDDATKTSQGDQKGTSDIQNEQQQEG